MLLLPGVHEQFELAGGVHSWCYQGLPQEPGLDLLLESV